MSPPGVRVNRGVFSSTVAILYLSTKLDDMNECDAPESDNTVARFELTRNSPSTTYSLCTLSLLRVDVVDAGSSVRLLAVVVALVVAADGDTVGSGHRWPRPIH